MCGFIGIIGDWQSVFKNLNYSWAQVAWRGEIHGGWFDEQCMVLASRLPRTGNLVRPQPVVLRSGNVVVLNGEIYNIDSLCEKYIGRKNIQDLSDTEKLALIIDSFVDLKDLVDQLRGEFSFAFFEKKNKRLHLVRDRLGSKPLFWISFGDSIAFSSSAKSLSQIQNIKINKQKVRDIFEFGVTESANVFDGVNSILSGMIMIFENKKLIQIDLGNPNEIENDLIIDILTNSINIRLRNGMSGLAYSGGIDSSIIRAICPNIPSYRIVLNECKDDNVYNVMLNRISIKDGLINLVRWTDKPISTLSSVAMHILASTMKQNGLHNMFTGEGSDEIFCGYPYLFQKSKLDGHPILKKHSEHFELACLLLGIKFGLNASPIFSKYLNSFSKLEWQYFDRSIRLPQHLLLSHSDLPGLSAGIETRLPFADFACYKSISPKLSLGPKYQLISFLKKEGILKNNNYKKNGLNVPFNILTDADLIELSSVSSSINDLEIFEDFELKCKLFFKRLSQMSTPFINDFREIVGRFILQYSSLAYLINNESKLELPLFYTSLHPNAEALVEKS